MSVLIKGMEMPKCCDDCPLGSWTDASYFYCALMEFEYTMLHGEILDDCPLVEVPTPHGDLIDRTKLYNDTANWEAKALEEVAKYDPTSTRDDWRWWSAVLGERGAFKHDVADAPTVIEAEVEE